MNLMNWMSLVRRKTMKRKMNLVTMSLISGVLLTGCASTLEQTYTGQNGRGLTVKITDATPFSNNIANTMATYENSVDPRTGAQTLKVTIGAARQVDRSAEAKLADMAIGALGAYLGAQVAGPPGAAAGGTAATAASHAVKEALFPDSVPPVKEEGME